MTLAVIFAVLAGMFKALRDRDLWGSDVLDTDPNKLWYASWGWYQAWSKTKRYFLAFPMDVWHNADVLCMTACYAAGRGRLDETVLPFLAIALTTKTIFYEFLLLKHPLEGFRKWLNKLRHGV